MRINKWLVILAIIIILVLVYLIGTLLADPAPQHELFSEGPSRPWVIAHRGGKGLWPENTTYAFEKAIALGVDMLEMDFHQTADGELVVIHDDSVDRTTDGTGLVGQLTLAQIQSLDAGYRWSADDGATFPFRGQQIRIPTLQQVFETIQQLNPYIRMTIEIKSDKAGVAAQFCQLLRDYKMTRQVIVGSFRDEALTEFRQACPEVPSSAGKNEARWFFAMQTIFLDRLYSPTAFALQVPEYYDNLHVLTPGFIRRAHGRNLEVHAWTINETIDMQRMLELGVDGIITDFPDILIELLSRP